MSPIRHFAIIAAMFFVICFSQGPLMADDSVAHPAKPLGVFFALHMEAGNFAPDFEFQQHYWPRLVDLIPLADLYQVKLTLLFNPQWAQYILMDQRRWEAVKAWQRNGHEIGLHYHKVTHNDWCGFTNRVDPIYRDSLHYEGNVPDMMNWVSQLAEPEPVVTACNGPDIVTQVYPFCRPVAPGFIDEVDFPEEILFDVDGIHDGITRPIPFEFKGKTRFHLRHGVAITQWDIEQRLEEIRSAQPDEVVGLVTHESDYDPELLHRLFAHLKLNGIPVHTVRHIMKTCLQDRAAMDRFSEGQLQ